MKPCEAEAVHATGYVCNRTIEIAVQYDLVDRIIKKDMGTVYLF